MKHPNKKLKILVKILVLIFSSIYEPFFSFTQFISLIQLFFIHIIANLYSSVYGSDLLYYN